MSKQGGISDALRFCDQVINYIISSNNTFYDYIDCYFRIMLSRAKICIFREAKTGI